MIQSENMRGAALMVAAMAGFALEDMALKAAMRTVPVGEALILFGLLGMCGFIVLARRRGQRVIHPAIRSKVMALRAVSEVMGRLGYTLAIALIPLSNASAILQATPLVVVGAAAIFFGEKVDWRRWLAVGIGFIGVLIILRPGGGRVQRGLPLGGDRDAGLCGARSGNTGRAADPVEFPTRDLWLCDADPTGIVMLFVSGGAMMPAAPEFMMIVAAAFVGVLAYWALTSAMRLGEISVVTPFRYTRLLFALILGALAFGERPDLAMMIGSVLIVGSGIYTLTHARRQPGVAPEGIDPRPKSGR